MDFAERRARVDVVEAGAPQGNQADAQSVQFVDDGLVQRVVDKDDDAIAPFCQMHRVGGQFRVVVFNGNERGVKIAVERGDVVFLGVKHGKFQHFNLLLCAGVPLYQFRAQKQSVKECRTKKIEAETKGALR